MRIIILLGIGLLVLAGLYWPILALYADALIVGGVSVALVALFVWALVRLPIGRVEYHTWHDHSSHQYGDHPTSHHTIERR